MRTRCGHNADRLRLKNKNKNQYKVGSESRRPFTYHSQEKAHIALISSFQKTAIFARKVLAGRSRARPRRRRAPLPLNVVTFHP